MLTIIRILLILWIASILMRWLKRTPAPKNTDSVKGDRPPGSSLDYTGTIDDADFEDIDGT